MLRSRAQTQAVARAAEQRVRALALSPGGQAGGWVPTEPGGMPTGAAGDPEARSNQDRTAQGRQLGPDVARSHRGAHLSTAPMTRLWEAAADRLPVTLRGGVLCPSNRATVALALLGLLAVAVGGWFAWQARPEQQPREVATVIEQGTQVRGGLADPSPGEPEASATAAAPPSEPTRPSMPATASPTTPTELVVHVVGRVLRPGVVHLPVGARVADAVAAVGGMTAGADPTRVNLARPLTDGEQVLVLAEGEPAPAAPAGSPSADATPGTPPGATAGVINLNTATLADLDTLPGVGPVLAQRILDWRETNGAFSSVDELREIAGVGEKRLADLRGKVTV